MGRMGERWIVRGGCHRDAFARHERVVPPGVWADPVAKLTCVRLSVTVSISIGRVGICVVASIDAGHAALNTIDLDRHGLDAGSERDLLHRISRASWGAGPCTTQRNGTAALWRRQAQG